MFLLPIWIFTLNNPAGLFVRPRTSSAAADATDTASAAPIARRGHTLQRHPPASTHADEDCEAGRAPGPSALSGGRSVGVGGGRDHHLLQQGDPRRKALHDLARSLRCSGTSYTASLADQQTLSIMIFQAIFGALIAFPATQRLFGSTASAKALWKWHRLSGYLLVFATSLTVWCVASCARLANRLQPRRQRRRLGRAAQQLRGARHRQRRPLLGHGRRDRSSVAVEAAPCPILMQRNCTS